jgi:hypothetical protein
MKKRNLILIGIGLVIVVLLFLLLWRQEDTRRWIQQAPTGFACEYRVFGVAGTCPVSIGDSVFIYCDIGQDGQCVVRNNETVRLCPAAACSLQLQLVDTNCNTRTGANVFRVVERCS